MSAAIATPAPARKRATRYFTSETASEAARRVRPERRFGGVKGREKGRQRGGLRSGQIRAAKARQKAVSEAAALMRGLRRGARLVDVLHAFYDRAYWKGWRQRDRRTTKRARRSNWTCPTCGRAIGGDHGRC